MRLKIITHNFFDAAAANSTKIINDIAILELATPLQLNENVQAITIGVGRTPVADESKHDKPSSS
jgi:hypothetical protein